MLNAVDYDVISTFRYTCMPTNAKLNFNSLKILFKQQKQNKETVGNVLFLSYSLLSTICLTELENSEDTKNDIIMIMIVNFLKNRLPSEKILENVMHDHYLPGGKEIFGLDV